MQIACEQIASSRHPEAGEGCELRFGCPTWAPSLSQSAEPRATRSSSPAPQDSVLSIPFWQPASSLSSSSAAPLGAPMCRIASTRSVGDLVGRRYSSPSGLGGAGPAWLSCVDGPCPAAASSRGSAPLPGSGARCLDGDGDRDRAGTGTGTSPAAHPQARTCSAQLPRRGCSCEIWLPDRKTKLFFKNRIKEGRKGLLKSAHFPLPGGATSRAAKPT